MTDSLSQSKEKPGATNITSINNTTIIHHAEAVHGGQGDNIISRKGSAMS